MNDFVSLNVFLWTRFLSTILSNFYRDDDDRYSREREKDAIETRDDEFDQRSKFKKIYTKIICFSIHSKTRKLKQEPNRSMIERQK